MIRSLAALLTAITVAPIAHSATEPVPKQLVCDLVVQQTYLDLQQKVWRTIPFAKQVLRIDLSGQPGMATVRNVAEPSAGTERWTYSASETAIVFESSPYDGVTGFHASIDRLSGEISTSMRLDNPPASVILSGRGPCRTLKATDRKF